MNIGVIYCAYCAADHIIHSLAKWLAAKDLRLGGHEYVICAVSVPFVGFPQQSDDGTLYSLRAYQQLGDIHLISGITPMPETEARGAALKWLVDQGVDVIWQADADEHITIDQIARIISFVESNPHITWFRLSFRNAVFAPNTYLAEPFTPPRIYRVRAGSYKAHSFYQDNNIRYSGTITRDLKQDDYFASMTVPKEVAWIKHVSWLSDIRSKQKVEYQQHRWGPPIGAGCMFAWDSVKGLVWNDEYFKLTGQPYPDLIHD